MNRPSGGAKKLRLFVALDIPSSYLDALDDALHGFRERVDAGRWTTRQQQHVTLKFIGWMEPERLADVRRACAAVASRAHRAEVSLAGLGAFPSPRRARVLWVGIDDPRGVTPALAADLDVAMGELGVEREDRSYTPHLTLARFKPPRDLRALEEVELPALDPFPVDAVTLYRSHLARGGPRYEVVERLPLR